MRNLMWPFLQRSPKLRNCDDDEDSKTHEPSSEFVGPLTQLNAGAHYLRPPAIDSLKWLLPKIISNVHSVNTLYRLKPTRTDDIYEFDLKSDRDILKSCHLMLIRPTLKSENIENYIDLVDVSVRSKNAQTDDQQGYQNTLQSVTGKALQFDAMVFGKAPVRITDESVIIPLNLFFESRWVPTISMARMSLHLRIKFRIGVVFSEAALLVCSVLLGTPTRRELCLAEQVHSIWLPYCQTMSTTGGPVEIDLVEMFPHVFDIREIFIQIKIMGPTDLDLLQDIVPMKPTRSVKSVNLFINDAPLYDDMPIEYFTETVTKDLYGINRDDVFVLPMDLTPRRENPSGTCNVSKLNSANIKMKMDAGEYQVTVFVRSSNIIAYSKGMTDLKYTA